MQGFSCEDLESRSSVGTHGTRMAEKRNDFGPFDRDGGFKLTKNSHATGDERTDCKRGEEVANREDGRGRRVCCGVVPANPGKSQSSLGRQCWRSRGTTSSTARWSLIRSRS